MLATKINDLNLYDDDHIENDEKIEYLKEVEEAAFEKKEIINTETSFSESKSNFILASSDGFLNGYKSSSFSASCVAVAKNLIIKWKEIMNLQVLVTYMICLDQIKLDHWQLKKQFKN